MKPIVHSQCSRLNQQLVNISQLNKLPLQLNQQTVIWDSIDVWISYSTSSYLLFINVKFYFKEFQIYFESTHNPMIPANC